MLNPDKALELARRLTAVANFPTYAEAIEATAEDLVYLTEDTPDADVAEARARWLVNEVRRTWPRWSGTADLFALYRKRFNPPREIKAEDNEAKSYGEKPPTQCQTCNDTGVFKLGGRESTEPYRWCECEQGIHLHFELPGWLETVNAEVEMPTRPPAVELPHPAAPKLVSDKVEQSIKRSDACPACGETRPHTHHEYWQHHTKQEIAPL